VSGFLLIAPAQAGVELGEARAQFSFNVARRNSLTDCVAAAVAAEL
jgi:hypothetical protein